MAKKTKAKPAKRIKLTPAQKEAKLKDKKREVALSFAEMGADSPHFPQWLKQNVLRKSFRRWPAYYMAFDKAKSRRILATNKRGVKYYTSAWECAVCGDWFRQKDLCVDHIEAVGGMGTSLEQLAMMIYRMFCRLRETQLLCNYKNDDTRFDRMSCHRQKTKEERAAK